MGGDGFLDLNVFFFESPLVLLLLQISVGFFFVGLRCVGLRWWVGDDGFDFGFLVDELIGFCNRMNKFSIGYDWWWYWIVVGGWVLQ